MPKIFFIFLFCVISLTGFAQKSKKDRKEERRQHIKMIMKQEDLFQILRLLEK